MRHERALRTRCALLIARMFLAVAAMALLLSGNMPARVTHAADITQFTATETFDPLGLLGTPVGELLDPGVVTCPGHEPTGNPLQPCPAGSRLTIRDEKFVSRLESSGPGLSGWMTVELNANWDADYTGPAWGTFSIALDGGGSWDGTWQGRRMLEDGTWVIPLHVVGHGTGGTVEGLQFTAVDRIVSVFPNSIAYIGTIEGRVVDPHAK